jgi:hypothetical protein
MNEGHKTAVGCLRAALMVSLLIVALPLLGMALPAFNGLRGFLYLWIPMGFVWLVASPVLLVWFLRYMFVGRNRRV